MNAGDDDRIIARIEAAADSMPDAPVRWNRVASLARRKALISAAAAVGLALAAAALLTVGGSVGSYGLHGTAPIPIPFAGVSVPDVRGMSEAGALNRLKHVGLDGAAEVRCEARSCIVRDSHPGAGTNVLSGSKVKLALRPSTPLKRRPQEGREAHRPRSNSSRKRAASKTPVPGRGKPAKIVLSISRAMVEADGKSVTTIEATVLDARGARLKGQRVTFSSSDPAERVDVRRVSDTVSIATVTSSKRPQPVTIRAHDGAIVAQIEFKQTPVEEAPKLGCGGARGSGPGSETTETNTSTTCGPGTQTTETNTTTTTTPATTGTTSTTGTTGTATAKSVPPG